MDARKECLYSRFFFFLRSALDTFCWVSVDVNIAGEQSQHERNQRRSHCLFLCSRLALFSALLFGSADVAPNCRSNLVVRIVRIWAKMVYPNCQVMPNTMADCVISVLGRTALRKCTANSENENDFKRNDLMKSTFKNHLKRFVHFSNQSAIAAHLASETNCVFAYFLTKKSIANCSHSNGIIVCASHSRRIDSELLVLPLHV